MSFTEATTERRAIFVVGDSEQSFQSSDRLRRQAFDEASISALAGKSARRVATSLCPR